LIRFASDDEPQVRGVLHDLCETRLIFSSGIGPSTVYRAASEEELKALRQIRPEDGLDELIWALIYQSGPITVDGILGDSGFEPEEIDEAITRLVSSGCVERFEERGQVLYRSSTLVIPLGAPAGWEAAVFDHYKAMVNTITARLSEDRSAPGRVGGSTFTVEVWEGHPLAEEVYGTLARIRAELGEQRAKVERFNAEHGLPDDYTRVVMYAGQCLISEGGVGNEEPA
jgi:hypothetical protein